jgi:hypothetical protein
MDERYTTKTDALARDKSAMMTTGMRKLVLTAHITFSVGWLGAVITYVALAITGLTSPDTRMVGVVYPALALIGWYVIVPSSLVALLTGLIQSLGTPWGLFRYYWVLVKFLLTFVASIILVNHMPVVSKMARMVTGGMASGPDFEKLRVQLLVHAAGGLLILLFTMVLSVYKPWGKTGDGLHNGLEQERQRWPVFLLIGLASLAVLFIIVHIITGGMSGHH